MLKKNLGNHSISQLQKTFLIFALAALLSKRALAEDHISAKWQDYNEDNGRIRVISKYVGIDKSITENISFKVHAVHDAISGATPTGSPDEDGSIPLADMSDERNSIVTDLVWIHGTQSETIQYARSKESDYLSLGYAYTHTNEFNKRNTRLSLGLSYVDDSIFASFMPQTETKINKDFFIGLTQVLDQNTVVTANLSHGESNGFLSDPYKTILQNVEILPELFLPLTFQENRPSSRSKDILFLNAKRHFAELDGSADISYRFFTDSWGIKSHTFDLEWYQKVGEHLRLIPKLRYYKQSAANFYALDLTGREFTAADEPVGIAPFYSADYRISKMDTFTYGLKIVYDASERFTLDASFERYSMSGRDRKTPADAYPSANVLTLGLVVKF